MIAHMGWNRLATRYRSLFLDVHLCIYVCVDFRQHVCEVSFVSSLLHYKYKYPVQCSTEWYNCQRKIKMCGRVEFTLHFKFQSPSHEVQGHPKGREHKSEHKKCTTMCLNLITRAEKKNWTLKTIVIGGERGLHFRSQDCLEHHQKNDGS